MYHGISVFALRKQSEQEKKSSYIICPAASMVPTSQVSITPQNPPRRLQAIATQVCWVVCVGVVLDTARDGC